MINTSLTSNRSQYIDIIAGEMLSHIIYENERRYIGADGYDDGQAGIHGMLQLSLSAFRRYRLGGRIRFTKRSWRMLVIFLSKRTPISRL